MEEQLKLQEEIAQKTGLILVTCGDCGSTLIQKRSQVVMVCPDCGNLDEPSGFPDLNYTNENIKGSKLYKMARKHEMILEEIYLNGDTEETDPNEVYCDSGNPQRPILFAVSEKTKKVRIWILKEDQDIIAEEFPNEILKSRLAIVTPEDEVSIGDIFIHGGYTAEIGYNEWDRLIQKRWFGSVKTQYTYSTLLYGVKVIRNANKNDGHLFDTIDEVKEYLLNEGAKENKIIIV